MKALCLMIFSLSQKINQLEDEQSKKSTSASTDEKNPRKVKNNAIKRLLIKNLRLAAMIASKEIQLEEAKARSVLSSKYCMFLTSLDT